MSQTVHANAAAIARAAFKQLALRKLAPTPENYAKFYAENAQVKLAEVLPVLAAIEGVARDTRTDPRRAPMAKHVLDALGRADWDSVANGLRSLVRSDETAAATAPGLARAMEADRAAPRSGTDTDIETVQALKDLFISTIELLIDERAGYSKSNVEQAKGIAQQVAKADTATAVHEAAAKLKNLWLTLELRGEGPEPFIRSLHGLVLLALRSVGDLGSEDRLVQREVEQAQMLLGEPLSPNKLTEVERSFKNLGLRQGTTRASIEEAKAAIRAMMASFVERLGTVTISTGEFSGRLARYSERIRSASDLHELAGVLEGLTADTNLIQADMVRTHAELERTRKKVAEYEARVADLENQLSVANELVREDGLTRVLNRRGLEQQFAVEQSRAKRRAMPLTIVMFDLDDFKKLNDRLGHQAGDAALRRVVEVAKATIRPTDTLARYGGEEFAILLPETSPEAAAIAIARVQQNLARRPLIWNAEEVPITFSAGIALYHDGEALASLIERADAAMYEAKRAGKNRSVIA
jgi:diguanylate cyclase